MKYFVEKSGSKIVAKGCISEDVELNPNQIKVTEKEYNNIKFDTVAERQQELEQTEEEKINFDDIKKEFNNKIQNIKNSIDETITKIKSDILNDFNKLAETVNAIKKQLDGVEAESKEYVNKQKVFSESISSIEERLKTINSLADKAEVTKQFEELSTTFDNTKSEIEKCKNRLEQVEAAIIGTQKEPELTDFEKINAQVVAKIRERYSVDNELKMLRIGLIDNKNIEYLQYLSYVKKCVQWGEQEKSKLGSA